MRKYLCDNFTCCVDVEVLLGALGCDYDADEWRLFTDSAKAVSEQHKMSPAACWKLVCIQASWQFCPGARSSYIAYYSA